MAYAKNADRFDRLFVWIGVGAGFALGIGLVAFFMWQKTR